MTMKTFGPVAAAALLSLAGCFSVDVASSPILGKEVVRHVTVENYGWYLLGRVPLVCGNEDFDSWCPFSLFCDEVRSEIVYSKLEALADREGCKIADLYIKNDNDVLFDAYYAPVPWLIVYRNVCFSANLVKKGGAQ